MLLALKPLACITFVCFSILVFLLAPNKTCNLPLHSFDPHIVSRNAAHQKENSIPHAFTCSGRRIYIHKLPPQFNAGLLRQCRYGITSWLDFCPHVAHRGLGKPLRRKPEVILPHGSSPSRFNSSFLQHPDRNSLHSVTRKMLLAGHASIEDHQYMHMHSWHRTDAYMLEVIFHHRLLHYPCLTDDPNLANAFFIPYYAGLDALKYLYTLEKAKPKVRHGLQLVRWLRQDAIAQETWSRYGGQDHFLVMGRTPWDFGDLGSSKWGTGILNIPEYDNMTLLLIEKQPWRPNQHAIPYPTSFHPQSTMSLQAWMRRVRIEERTTLFTFAGSIRPALMKGGIRDMLLDQCRSSKECKLLDCKHLKCSHNPQPIMSSFLASQFCLQPRGDTPTRRSLFDSLIAGCIPVVFHNDTAYTQYEWHLPHDAHTWSVYISEDEIKRGALVKDILMAYKQEQIQQIRKALLAVIPRVIYTGYGEGRGNLELQQGEADAFDVSVREVLKLVAEKKKAFKKTQSKNPNF